MSEEFDPYHRWLGIPPKYQPPDHYRLLGIESFEADVEVISDAAERQIAHVRRKSLGLHSRLSQTIRNELAGAKACLLDPIKKVEYDKSLQANAVGEANATREASAVRGSPDPAPGTTRAVRGSPDPAPDTTAGLPNPEKPAIETASDIKSPPPDLESEKLLPAAGIVVACACGQRFLAQPRLAGQTVVCPTCGRPIRVPSADSSDAPRDTSPPVHTPRQPVRPNLLRRADQFLLRIVGAENAWLHQCLRIALLVGLVASINAVVAVADQLGVPFANRGTVGIRQPRRKQSRVQLWSRLARSWRICLVWFEFRFEDAHGRHEAAECLGLARHAR